MFWRFGGYANISAIDTLLDKPEVSLEELLDESELIQELKQHNTKLIEYLREDHVLKRLMDYVIAPSLVNDDVEEANDAHAAEPANDAAEEKQGDPLKEVLDPEDLENAERNRLKHAYVACEILSSEIWSILESILLNRDYLRDFWGFLRRPPQLDSIQASYFTKVNETLFDKKTEEMLDFFKSLDGAVPAILQHVDNPMVMDLLLKIISLERAEGGQGIVDVSVGGPGDVQDANASPVVKIPRPNSNPPLLLVPGIPCLRPDLGRGLPESHYHHIRKRYPERSVLYWPQQPHPRVGLRAVRGHPYRGHAERRKSVDGGSRHCYRGHSQE